MVGEELHTKDVIELADAVKLYSIRVIDIEPLLLSYCIHGLTMEPPAETQNQFHLTEGMFMVAGNCTVALDRTCFVMCSANVETLTSHHLQSP